MSGQLAHSDNTQQTCQ